MLSAYSPNTAKYFRRILHRHLDTFHVYLEYAERMENKRRKKFLLSTMPDKVKVTVFREHRMRDHKLAYDELITNFMFWLS
jgi:hypothetical protein